MTDSNATTTLSPYLPETQIQFAWDSTSLGYLKTCPRLYQYTMLEGWSPRGESIHLRFGIEFHKALEEYDRAKVAGAEHEDAIRSTIHDLLTRTHGWEVDEDTRAGKYKNRSSLLRLVLDYLDHFAEDPAETFIREDGRPAVELSFRFELDWRPEAASTGMVPGNRQSYLLCGHLDRVVTFAGDLFVMDRKAQPLTTKVLTPKAWTKIGDLKVDDLIAGQDGCFYPVKALYPKGMTRVYRITFNDKTYVECGEDHLWHVAKQTSDLWQTLSLQEMLAAPDYVKFHIPLVKPIQHEEAELPIHPYVLGTLLGNGYLAGNSIQLSTSDRKLAKNVGDLLYDDTIREGVGESLSWTISGGNTLEAIRELGLYGCKSADKFIPELYVFASIEQRFDLLQGLLDTDGSWNGDSRRYQSMSLDLIQGICTLARSLGGTARYIVRSDGCYRASIRMRDWPTGIGRRYITSIEEVESAETMCIESSSPDGLYVTENYTVTHNTTTTTPGPYYFAQYDPNNQMSLYILASQILLRSPIKGVIIDAAQVLIDSSRFVRGFTYRTPDQLEEWVTDLRRWLALAEGCATEGYWPMNDTACDKFGGCRFRHVCSKSPQVRKTFLKSDFEKLAPEDRWNPLKPR